MNLQDLERMIAQSGGLYPLDMYRRGTTPGGGITTLKDVNLPGVDAPQAGGVSMVNNIPRANLPTANIPTGGSANRLDDLISQGGGGRSPISSLLSNFDKDEINLGNIDDIANLLTNELYPQTTGQDRGFVKDTVLRLIAAGQSPEFQRGFLAQRGKEAKAEAELMATKQDTRKTIYGKLLDDFLEEGDSFTPKLEPVFTINRSTGEETGGVIRKIRDGKGFETDEVFALATNEKGEPLTQDQMSGDQIFYQGNVYRPLDPQAESWDKDRLNLRSAFDLDRQSGSQTAFDKRVDKYSERLLALDALYGLANSGLSLLGEIVPAATDQFGLAQAVKGLVVSGNQQINEMSNILLGDEQVSSLAKNIGISVDELKAQNAASTERMREVFDDPNKLNGIVGADGNKFNWDRFGRLSDDKAKDSQYKSILLQMAYQAAMINGQEGRSLSDKDIVNMLNIVGGEVSDVNGAIRLMSSFVLSTTANLEKRGKRLRETYVEGVDKKPYSKEAVEIGFKDPFKMLVEDKPNTTRSVMNIINLTHPDLLETQLLDSSFDYKSFINPNTADSGTDNNPPLTEEEIEKIFTDLIMRKP